MNHPPAVRKILKEVAVEFGLTPGEMIAGGRRKPLPQARARAAWRLRNEMKHRPGLKTIAFWLEVDHTSVIAMLRRYPKAEPYCAMVSVIQQRANQYVEDFLLKVTATEGTVPFNPNEPDTSGEWAI